MNNKSLIKSLEFIRNKGFCHYTVHRAIKEFEKIQYYLKDDDRKVLSSCLMNIDPNYPDFTGSEIDYGWFARHINQIINLLKEGR